MSYSFINSTNKPNYQRNRSFSHYQKNLEVPNPQTPYEKKRPNFPNAPEQIQPLKLSNNRSPNKFKNSNSLGNHTNLPPLGVEKSYSTNTTVSKSSHGFSGVSDRYLQNESIFEAFLINAMEMKLDAAIEETVTITLKANNVLFWQDIPSLHTLYSEKLHQTVSHSSGLVGFTFFSREITKFEAGQIHPSFSEQIDEPIVPFGKVHVLLFPLWDFQSNIIGVVEIIRDIKEPMFDDNDMDFILYFIKKFKFFSHWIGNPKFPHDNIAEMLQSMELEQFLLVMQKNMGKLFQCKICEIWEFDQKTNSLLQYSKDIKQYDISQAGIVWESLSKNTPINCSINKLQSSYYSLTDGPESEPVLVVPLEDIKLSLKYAIILRGRKNIPIFTKDDETSLKEISPYLALGLQNNIKNRKISSETGNVKEHLLFEGLVNFVDDLISNKSIKYIIEHVLENLQLLVNADRCYLFEYDSIKESLITTFYTGLKKPLSISIDHGIVGKTYRGNKIYNIPNAYDDIDFDASLDHDSNYMTRSLISVPVMNNRGETISVIQMLNKRDGKPFSNQDSNFIRIFSVLCGILIENNEMYNNSTESNQQLRSFLNVAFSLSSNQSMKTVLSDIMQNARSVINAERASLFLVDKVLESLIPYIADGGKMPNSISLSNGIAATAATKKTPIIVNDAYHDPRFNKMVDYQIGFKTKSLLAVPVISSEGDVIGVAEMINKIDGGFTQDDLKLLQSFSTFAGMSLETNRLKDITEKGRSEIEMTHWIGDMEKPLHIIPTKLCINANKLSEVEGLNFFCIEWNGIGLFKVAYHIFDQFSLLNYFLIPNNIFFTFLFRLREEYNEPPYHNWIHAIDVLQYVYYQVKVSGLITTFTKLELLALSVAALCHDAGHQGFNNDYNIKSATPLGILFKDKSVMEVHHCTVAIRILSKDECNIFKNLSSQDLKTVWNWIVTLILATDMAEHFKLLKQANEVFSEGSVNLENPTNRLITMTMLMKVADISNVSRPFEIASKWCEVLVEEFFNQGDMEKSQGLPFSSPLNDREHQDIPKGQIGFYNFICIPLYQAISKLLPELNINLDTVKQNLNKWKEISEKKNQQIETT